MRDFDKLIGEVCTSCWRWKRLRADAGSTDLEGHRVLGDIHDVVLQ